MDKRNDGKKLLIVGIDPGMTTAYAVLDIEGRFIKAYSSKQLELNSIISDIIGIGKAILVGTDKSKVPGLVEDFAIKVGARVISPNEDLKVEEKRKMSSDFEFENDHESDAIASALFAYRAAKPLLDKIDIFARDSKKQHIRNLIKEIVIAKRISIRNAAGIIEKKDEESGIVAKAITEKKFSEKDFIKMYSRLKSYENELKLVRMHNSSLRSRISSLENAPKHAKQRNDSKTIDFREKRIFSLENSIKSREAENEKLKSVIRKLNFIISNANDYYILKKLDSLGINEFNHKNKSLNIRKNDILLVDDPNIVSEQVIDSIRNDVSFIIHKKPLSRKIESQLPFAFISIDKLEIEEDRYFGFVDKKNLEMEKSKADWAKKIIDEYKNERLIPR